MKKLLPLLALFASCSHQPPDVSKLDYGSFVEKDWNASSPNQEIYSVHSYSNVGKRVRIYSLNSSGIFNDYGTGLVDQSGQLWFNQDGAMSPFWLALANYGLGEFLDLVLDNGVNLTRLHIVPHPFVIEQYGLHLEAERNDDKAHSFQIYGYCFPPNEPVDMVITHGNRVFTERYQANKDGTFILQIVADKLVNHGGEIKINFSTLAGDLTLVLPWGDNYWKQNTAFVAERKIADKQYRHDVVWDIAFYPSL